MNSTTTEQVVSMPSRAYTSFLRKLPYLNEEGLKKCQCPLGLIPHFYNINIVYNETALIVSMPSRAYTSFLRVTIHMLCTRPVMCQCPLGLIPHFYITQIMYLLVGQQCVNALSGLYLISTIRSRTFSRRLLMVSMPSRAYTSFLHGGPLPYHLLEIMCQCPLGLIPHFYDSYR